MAVALAGARVFDGETIRDGLAVVIDGARVVGAREERTLEKGIRIHRLGGGLLAPGFIDVQVNGGGGALFNEDPSIGTVKRIAAAHRKHGTTGMLPTVITDAPVVLSRALSSVARARSAGVPGILGIHVEGPFLDSVRKGAHDERFIRAMEDADIAQLAAADCGVVMLTLAPNMVPPAMIRKLADSGILISLGHSDATSEQALAALAAGATAFTHIFNAMSQMTGRDPGMAGAALADRESFVGLIADGHHVHDTAMRVLLAAKPRSRIMLISDAMPPAAGGPDVFYLQGRKTQRIEGRLELEDGTLAGSTLTMGEAVRYCVHRLAVPLEDALRMASLNPATFIAREAELGRIAPGFLAGLVHLDDGLHVRRTWIDGVPSGEP